MSELTNKEKIILILKESIKFGKEANFIYDGMLEKHKDVSLIKKINEKMELQIVLFKNLDEASQTFKSIFDCAKIALRKLQDEEKYNYYSADLILKIHQLESCFKKKLKPVGFRLIDANEKITTKQENNIVEIEKQNENFENELSGQFISENMNGRKLQTKNNKRKEIINALTENTFTE